MPSPRSTSQKNKLFNQSNGWNGVATIKWASVNLDLNIELSGEYYPQYREGNNEVTGGFQQIKGELDSYANTNREIKNYFSELKERCEKTVEERLAHPQDGEKSHDNHHWIIGKIIINSKLILNMNSTEDKCKSLQ